ncbi:MAG: histone acetyltransferase [Gammaproteobacteria bacterium]|nr:histone acetyltransferase [Gammaproteobacteria bacterium]|tara:strand:+ start:7125 stop:7589 length:465 start_codon:yes stop_codon:yes gene_type:complete
MSEITYKTPGNKKEFKEYDLFRWKILRKPLGKDISSLKDKYDKSAFHIIGIKDKKIIACGRLHFNKTYEAQIRYMAVSQNLQGTGIGKQVLKLLEKNAMENNARKIILNARDHAIDFYRISGYKTVKKYNGSDTGIPHTTMEKNYLSSQSKEIF